MTIMFLLPTNQVSAALVRCRTDPVFVFSNGDVMSVTLDIGTQAANISHIAYVLHVPAGVTVKNVAYTARNLRLYETYLVEQDSRADTYTVDTSVTTQNRETIDVTIFGRLNGGIRNSVAGFEDQSLSITLNRQ
jgi:hypothetical protein